MATVRDTDLPDLLISLGYQVKRIGRYYTTQEMDSIRIKDRRTWFRYATYLEEHLNGFPHYDDEVVRKMIERVTVVDAETIRVKFRYSDLEIEQSVC